MGVVSVLFVILAVYPANSAQNSYGKRFIIAFPENIAFYHPTKPNNKIQITALWDHTRITLDSTSAPRKTKSLSKGEPYSYDVTEKLELGRSSIINMSLLIDSNKDIIVYAISRKVNSIQTALVVPIDHLGTTYQIPPVPRIESMSNSEESTSVATPILERRPFRLTVINGETANNVILSGAAKQNASLGPYQLAQFWLSESAAAWSVLAENPVAVLFGHPCAATTNCTCATHLTPLTPTEGGEDLKFLVPPCLAGGAEGNSSLLATTMDGSVASAVAFDQEASSPVTSAGSAVFYRPGMLLGLIPTRDFSFCYVLHTVADIDGNHALLVVPRGETDGVHLGKNTLVDPRWTEMIGTGYSWAIIALKSGKNVIWHSNSRMAVYFMGTHGGTVFGNPAAGISNHPDFRGCVLTPEVLTIGDKEAGWAESLQYCGDNGTKLISLHTAEFQQHIAAKLESVLKKGVKKGVKKVWIGLRRSSLTGEWYWLNKAAVGTTKWAKGEPGTSEDGQCAVMSLDSKDDFGWKDDDCCSPAPPICYKEPVLFPYS